MDGVTGIPAFWASSFPKPSLVIWASPASNITLAIWVRVRVGVTGDAHITRVLGMGIPKTRGCSYHSNNGTIALSIG